MKKHLVTAMVLFMMVSTGFLVSSNQQKSQHSSTDAILWDNYGFTNDSAILFSQLDIEYPFNSQVADDFILDADAQIKEVHWWGAFTSGIPPWPNPSDFNIIFYADDGTGNMPTGGGMDDPTSTALAVYHMFTINGSLFSTYDNWFEYNVNLTEPFNVSANTKYWIAIQIQLPVFPKWGWGTNGNYPDTLHDAMQGFPLLDIPYWTNPGWGDMAFYLIGDFYIPQPPTPDLFCSGRLEWTEIKPGATVYGEFSIENNGESGSLLDWEIESSPTWGTWTFIPSSGSDLAAGNMIMVNVTCVAPDEKPNEFTGNITIVNVENTSDYCVIPVYLKTPQITGVLFLQFLERFLVRFPNAFPRLRYILGC